MSSASAREVAIARFRFNAWAKYPNFARDAEVADLARTVELPVHAVDVAPEGHAVQRAAEEVDHEGEAVAFVAVDRAVRRAIIPPDPRRRGSRCPPPPCRAPPGQYTGTRQAHPRATPSALVLMPSALLSTPRQRFALARLPGPHLTHPVRLFLIAHHDGLQPTQHEVV